MRSIELIKSAFSSIFSRKVRSFLTSLGVIIGVFAVSALLSVGEASIKQMNEHMSDLNANVISANIMREDASVSATEVEGLSEAKSIKAAAPIAKTYSQVQKGISEMQVSVAGTTKGYAQIKDYKLATGRFILPIDVEEETDAAVIGQTVALKLFGHANVLGQRFMLGERSYTVVGVLKHMEQGMEDNPNEQVIIPLSTGQKVLDMEKITEFSILAASKEDITAAKAEVKMLMDKKNLDKDDYYINSSDDLNKYMEESNKTMMALLGGLGGISLLVSGIGIMNIMLVSVRERTREIGIRKAIGAKRRDILIQFLVEAVALSAMGGLVGIGLTFAAATPVGSLMKMTISPSISIVLIAIVFSVIVGIVFGVYPAIKASKLRPIEALHYE